MLSLLTNALTPNLQLIPAYFYLTQVYWIWTYCNALVIFDREREDRLYGASNGGVAGNLPLHLRG